MHRNMWDLSSWYHFVYTFMNLAIVQSICIGSREMTHFLNDPVLENGYIKNSFNHAES